MSDSKQWRARCGVCLSAWVATMTDDNDPATASFCPQCRQNGLSAPGVLNWKADPPAKPENLQDAAEQVVIAYGMGWDLDGVMQGLVDALPPGSVCAGQRILDSDAAPTSA